MRNPKISIIMPVYHAEQYLSETVRALQAQTFSDFEVIFVDDGSTDGSRDLLNEIVQKDSRFSLLHQPHSGAGAARNLGLAGAEGQYVIFSDCDDLYTTDMLAKLYEAASANQADITACSYAGLDTGGKVHLQTGIQTNLLPPGRTVFSYRDCPRDIMRITGSMVWNKLYRRAFILDNGLRFDELLTCNDLSFAAVSLAAAERVTYVTDHLVRYHFPRLNNPKKLEDVRAAVESTFRQAEKLPQKDAVRNAVLRFGIDHYIRALKNFVKDFSAPDAAAFYQNAHETFNRKDYLGLGLPEVRNGELYREFRTVQKHDYETMKLLLSRRIIVSLTSYPKRIGTVAKALETIYAQTKQADEVVLWLAEEQFPNKEADLPENLRVLMAEKRLTVRWCEDLKGHKKYFYALQEYTNDVVVTMDDDLLYPKDMLETLHKSYLLYPNAISTMRSHLILLSEDKRILSYREWLRETDGCMHQPSMQLMASGGAGDLYPPNLYRKEFFDRDVVLQRCLWADNLWVKIMELVSDVPVVLTRQVEPLRYVEDTQEETLFQINGEQNQYDTQMQDVISWLDETFGPNILQEKLTRTDLGVSFHTIEEISRHVNVERKINKTKFRNLENKQKQAATELEQWKKRAKEAERRQKQTEALLRQAQESQPIGRQLKALGESLHERRKERFTLSLMVKFLIYYLAWIPEKLLAAMMYFLRNGLKYSLKHLYHKLLGRG